MINSKSIQSNFHQEQSTINAKLQNKFLSHPDFQSNFSSSLENHTIKHRYTESNPVKEPESKKAKVNEVVERESSNLQVSSNQSFVSSLTPSTRSGVGVIIDEMANKYGVPASLITKVIETESNFDVKAVSPSGAMGLMQLMPKTAEGLGVKDAFNPRDNIEGGVKYLSQMLKRYGNVSLALAAYNAGPGNVDKYGGIPPFKETQNYVRKILNN